MWALGVAMLDWIVMDVIEMPMQIVGIADSVFPEAFEPHAACPLALARLGNRALVAAGSEVGAGKGSFNVHNANGVVRIAVWKCHEDVQVIRQQNEGVEGERMMPMAVVEGMVEQGAN